MKIEKFYPLKFFSQNHRQQYIVAPCQRSSVYRVHPPRLPVTLRIWVLNCLTDIIRTIHFNK